MRKFIAKKLPRFVEFLVEKFEVDDKDILDRLAKLKEVIG